MSETYSLADATLKAIQDRRSVREFTNEPISDHDLDLILEAARQAPSGENAQPWRFIVVKDEATRKKMGAIAGGGSGRRFTAEFVTKKMQERFANLQDGQAAGRLPETHLGAGLGVHGGCPGQSGGVR